MDEHGAAALAVGLRGYGIDVTTTPEAGLLEASDQEQLAYAAANGRVVVTHDEDFLVLNASGIPHAGPVCATRTPSRSCPRRSGKPVGSSRRTWRPC